MPLIAASQRSLVGDLERGAGVVAELEFGNVAEQVGLAAMLVDAAHTSLDQ